MHSPSTHAVPLTVTVKNVEEEKDEKDKDSINNTEKETQTLDTGSDYTSDGTTDASISETKAEPSNIKDNADSRTRCTTSKINECEGMNMSPTRHRRSSWPPQINFSRCFRRDIIDITARQNNVLLHHNIRMDDGAQGVDQIGSHIISQMAQQTYICGLLAALLPRILNFAVSRAPVSPNIRNYGGESSLNIFGGSVNIESLTIADGTGNSSTNRTVPEQGSGVRMADISVNYGGSTSQNVFNAGVEAEAKKNTNISASGQSTTADTQVRKNEFILHTKPSHPEAFKFGEHLKSEFDVDVSIDGDVITGMTEFVSMVDAVRRYNYKLVYVTDDLHEDNFTSFRQQLALLVDTKFTRKGMVIPVYPKETLCDTIPELTLQKGIKDYDFLEGSSSKVNAYRKALLRLFDGDPPQGLLRRRRGPAAGSPGQNRSGDQLGSVGDGDSSVNSIHQGGHGNAGSPERNRSEDQLGAVGGLGAVGDGDSSVNSSHQGGPMDAGSPERNRSEDQLGAVGGLGAVGDGDSSVNSSHQGGPMVVHRGEIVQETN